MSYLFNKEIDSDTFERSVNLLKKNSYMKLAMLIKIAYDRKSITLTSVWQVWIKKMDIFKCEKKLMNKSVL